LLTPGDKSSDGARATLHHHDNYDGNAIFHPDPRTCQGATPSRFAGFGGLAYGSPQSPHLASSAFASEAGFTFPSASRHLEPSASPLDPGAPMCPDVPVLRSARSTPPPGGAQPYRGVSPRSYDTLGSNPNARHNPNIMSRVGSYPHHTGNGDHTSQPSTPRGLHCNSPPVRTNVEHIHGDRDGGSTPRLEEVLDGAVDAAWGDRNTLQEAREARRHPDRGSPRPRPVGGPASHTNAALTDRRIAHEDKYYKILQRLQAKGGLGGATLRNKLSEGTMLSSRTRQDTDRQRLEYLRSPRQPSLRNARARRNRQAIDSESE